VWPHVKSTVLPSTLRKIVPLSVPSPADGRRCRTPLCSGSSFCFFHARKEAQARAADLLGHDISYFFSGLYLSACDLSTALGRVFAAAAQGHIKPRTASRLAYLGQVLVQTIHLAQDEYINAFGTEGWRNAVRRSVDSNSDYLDGLANEDSSQPAPPSPAPPPVAPPPSQTDPPAETTAPPPRPHPTPSPVTPPEPNTVSAPALYPEPLPVTTPLPVPPQAPRPAAPD
jgi:hypothetical protein